MSGGVEALEPADEAALVEMVAAAAREQTPLKIVGGDTRAGLGRPVQAARTLSTRALSGVTLYEPGALTLVAQAGTPLSEIEALLAEHDQQLPFEPIAHAPLYARDPGAATLGGVVATGASGPRRIQAGACRDFLIGVRFVNGRGEAVKAGGRVMKNVTGYDLSRLMAGAFGTLGVLSEVAFKVLPSPRHSATVVLRGLEDARAVAAMSAALGSPYDVTGAAHLPQGRRGSATTMLRLEGFADSVRGRSQKLARDLAEFGAAEIVDDAAESATGWAYVRDVGPFADGSGALWRVSVKPSDGPALVAAIGAEREAQAFYDWGGGLVWLTTPEMTEDDPAGAHAVRREAERRGGRATLVRASDTLRAALDVFPPEAGARARLSEGVRQRFDPVGILNPGRMRPAG